MAIFLSTCFQAAQCSTGLPRLLAVPATSKRTTLIFAKATFSQAAQYIIKAGGLDFAPGLTSSYAYRIGRWQIY